MRQLQWSSRRGRRILRTQVAAMLISARLLSAIAIAALSAPATAALLVILSRYSARYTSLLLKAVPAFRAAK